MITDANPFRYLKGIVFPSKEPTIAVQLDEYGGAHKYYITNTFGITDGVPVYDSGRGQTIQFIYKDAEGNVVPGIQNEQLVLVLIDRIGQLNAAYPCPENEEMIKVLQQFILLCEARIKERLSRNVAGVVTK